MERFPRIYPRVFNFGSLNIDYTYDVDEFVKPGETITSSHLTVSEGGKGLNQSVALARADAEVYHAGMIGEDGAFLVDFMKSFGVHTDLIETNTEVRTGNAIIQRNSHGDNCIVLYPGSNRSLTREYIDRCLERTEPRDWILTQNETSELPYIIEQAHRRELTVCLNASPVDELLEQVDLSLVDYLFVNEGEAQALVAQASQRQEITSTQHLEFFYTPEDYQDLDDLVGVIPGEVIDVNRPDVSNEIVRKSIDNLEKLITLYPTTTIILTMGDQGALLAHYGERALYQPRFHTDYVVDTTGAGDTFTGFFISSMMRHGNTELAALSHAALAAAFAVGKKGAARSIPDAYEIFYA